MKKIFLFVLIVFIYLGVSAQSSIRIYTDLKEESAMFTVYLNDEAQDATPWTETVIKNVKSGSYKLRVVFEDETVSDCERDFIVEPNMTIEYKVIRNSKFLREGGKFGRSLGRVLKQTKKNQKEGLIKYYRLQKIKK